MILERMSDGDKMAYQKLLEKGLAGREDYKIFRREYKVLKGTVEKIEKKIGITADDVGEKGSRKHLIYILLANVKCKFPLIEHKLRMHKDWKKQFTRESGAYFNERRYGRFGIGAIQRLDVVMDTINGKITGARNDIRLANKRFRSLDYYLEEWKRGVK